MPHKGFYPVSLANNKIPTPTGQSLQTVFCSPELVNLLINKVRNALVANRCVIKLFLTEFNLMLKIFHVSQSVSEWVSA